MSAYSGSNTTDYPPRVNSYRPRANTPPNATGTSKSSNTQTSRNVSFGKINKREEEKDKRQKYLTARYGQHQMMLIRKRLAVEDWLYEKLRDLYNCENDDDDHECTLDLEDILNLDSDSECKSHAYSALTDVKKPPHIVDGFVQELLQKVRML